MGLVDYGSDSEEDTVAPVVAPIPKPATKRAKGPVRIMLDLPKPSTSAPPSTEPPAKRAKFIPGSSGGGGLAAMLPKPKNESVQLRLEKSLGGAEGGAAFVPTAIAKGVKKAEGAAQVDFFGLSAATPTASTSFLLSIAKPSLSISSAPTVESSNFGAPPTAKDPYPGFVKDSTGTWIAKDIATYELYLASIAETAEEELQRTAPKGFDVNAGMVEVDARKSREAWENRPGQEVPRPGSEATNEPLKPKPGIKLAAKGKSRHQLSSLLAEAQQNRAEMEEKFAVGRANRKSAGNKYGF